MYLPLDVNTEKMYDVQKDVVVRDNTSDEPAESTTEDIAQKLKSLLTQAGIPAIDENLLMRGLLSDSSIFKSIEMNRNNAQLLDLIQSENDFIDAYNALTRLSPLPNIDKPIEEFRKVKETNQEPVTSKQNGRRNIDIIRNVDRDEIPDTTMLNVTDVQYNEQLLPSESQVQDKIIPVPSNSKQSKVKMKKEPTNNSKQNSQAINSSSLEVTKIEEEKSNNLNDIVDDTQKLIQQMKEEINSDINSLDGRNVSQSEADTSSNESEFSSEHESSYSDTEEETDNLSSDEKQSFASKEGNDLFSEKDITGTIMQRTSSEENDQFEEAMDHIEDQIGDFRNTNIQILDTIARSLQEEHSIVVEIKEQQKFPSKRQDLNNNVFKQVNTFEEIYEQLNTNSDVRGLLNESKSNSNANKVKKVTHDRHNINIERLRIDSPIKLIITQNKSPTYNALLETDIKYKEHISQVTTVQENEIIPPSPTIKTNSEYSQTIDNNMPINVLENSLDFRHIEIVPNHEENAVIPVNNAKHTDATRIESMEKDIDQTLSHSEVDNLSYAQGFQNGLTFIDDMPLHNSNDSTPQTERIQEVNKSNGDVPLTLNDDSDLGLHNNDDIILQPQRIHNILKSNDDMPVLQYKESDIKQEDSVDIPLYNNDDGGDDDDDDDDDDNYNNKTQTPHNIQNTKEEKEIHYVDNNDDNNIKNQIKPSNTDDITHLLKNNDNLNQLDDNIQPLETSNVVVTSNINTNKNIVPTKSSIPKLIKIVLNNKPKSDKSTTKVIASKVPVRRTSIKQYPAPTPPKTHFGNIQSGHVKQLQTRLFNNKTQKESPSQHETVEVKPSTSSTINKKKPAPQPPTKTLEQRQLSPPKKQVPKEKENQFFRETCRTEDEWTESDSDDSQVRVVNSKEESNYSPPSPPPPITLRRVSGQLIDLAKIRLPEGSPERQARMLLAEGAMENWDQAQLAVELISRGADAPSALLAALECVDLTAALTYLHQDCELCASRFPEHEMVSMLRCIHRCCRECAKHYFTVQITERSIADCVCPYCKIPELENLPEDEWLEYFAHLDILLKTLLETETHELFQRKLRDRTLARDPNFRWCMECSSGFFVHPKQKKLRCPECKSISCASCRKQWSVNHEGLTCEQYAAWLDDNDPERSIAAVNQHLRENGLECPRCHFKYSLSRGGCMHFTCTQCKYEFCYGCGKPFTMGARCGLSEYCAKLGLHSHHPRNCLFYLRDKEPHELQTLLQMNNVTYETEAAEGSTGRCPIQLQRETPTGLIDGICGSESPPNYAGLCKTHYVEYLAGRARALDPIPIMDVSELVAELRRRALPLPERGPWDTDPIYAGMCAEIVREKIPLD